MLEELQPGSHLRGAFWPEEVKVLRVQQRGLSLHIEAVGVETEKYYQRMLSAEDWQHVQVIHARGREFTGRGQAFLLGIEAHRIRYAHQFDPLLAVNTSQVDPLPHQIENIYHIMLPQPRLRFLLADDPGAGKTIMTGLLLRELKCRGLVRRVMIVIPSHLRDLWVREMHERFGESFTVVDRGTANSRWGRNIWLEEPQIITSLDFAKQDDVLAAIAEAEWDLVVVDEAHKLAAYRYAERVEKTKRYRLGEVLSRRARLLLFLTATPHRGDPENFRLLLDLLVPGMFANQKLLAESIQKGENSVYIRRLKEDLKDFEGRPLFPPRHVTTIQYRLNDDEKRLYNGVTEYVERSYNIALADEKRNVAFALLVLQRRLGSSVRAVRRSLERRRERLRELLRLGKWIAEQGAIDEEELEDCPEWERWRQEDELIERLTAAKTQKELEEEIEKLGELIQLAQQAERHEVETKLAKLREVMENQHLRTSGEKLLIFTEFRDTMEYLAEKISQWGYTVTTLHGGLNLDARIAAEHEFRHTAQVMVSTEAGGEGVNLQFCSLMINYDIPWNPNRLEQRMGRIHRYGQQKEVYVYNLVAGETREGAVLAALFAKLERIREALGSDRVFDVIQEVLTDRSLRELLIEAIAGRRTMDEIVAEIEAIPDQKAIVQLQKALQIGLATRHLDLQRLLEEDRTARENRLVPEYIAAFFEQACAFLEVPFQKRNHLWRVPRIPYPIRNVSLEFKHRYGEVFDHYTKLAFEKKIARREEAEFIAPGHPLLEALVEHILKVTAQDLKNGAVFSDPSGSYEGWLWFFEMEIRDGADQVAGKRLFCVYQPREGTMRLIPPAVLWDLKPLDPATLEPAEKPLLSSEQEEEVLTYAMENIQKSYLEEIRQQRAHQAKIKCKYGLRSLEHMLGESQEKLLDYETRRAKGENIPDVIIREEEQRFKELQERKHRLEEEIRLETALAPLEPRIIGIAQVIPAPETDRQLHTDLEIEQIGMQVVMEYERQRGWNPVDVSAEKLGYDVRSTSAQEVRYIEVKARATTGPIVLTPNEWMMAQRLGPEYWLYIVTYAATHPQLYLIQDPASKLVPEEVQEVVRYIVRDWEAHLSELGEGTG